MASSSILVPILVSSDPNVAQDPSIGYNVIEEVINQQFKQQGTKNIDCTANLVSSAFDIDVDSAKTFIQLIQAHQIAGEETPVTIRQGSLSCMHTG